jgi:hypothetical protein
MKLGWTPAHDHRHPALSECIGDLIAAVHVTRHRRDANEVRLELEIDRLDVLIGQYHLITISRNGARDGEQACKRRVKRPIEIERRVVSESVLGLIRWMTR